MKYPAPAPRRSQPGFALLITIVLVAFLVLLLVGLAAFTRVETRVADNSQTQAKARQNALMGLNLALGRLQAAAGPDTRVTATADLVPGRDIDKKHWTGVWDATLPGPEKNTAWLVSGNAPAGAAGVASALAAAPGNRLVELVDAGSTDTAVAGNRIRVETQPIGADTVPGFTGPQTVGNFAYWVGDEGVKANVTLTDPWSNPAPATLDATVPATTADQARRYQFINAQRMGIEGVDQDGDDTRLASAADPVAQVGYKAALPRVLSLPQLSMAGSDPDARAALASAARNRFHDLTADSRSVLADVSRGGLKKDLTAWIADTTSNPSGSVAADDDYITPGAADDSSKYGLPKWALIRDYAATRDAGSAIPPRPQTPERQGVYPIITYARMAYNVTCPGGALGGIYKINVMPVVALWNPYNVPIAAAPGGEATFEFCVRYEPPSAAIANLLQLVTYAAAPNNPARDYLNVNNISITQTPNAAAGTPANTTYYGTGSGTQFWRFKVRLTSDLAAGESRLFTIDDSFDDTEYVIGQSTLSDVVVDSANAVHLLSRRPLTAQQMASFIFWNTEPNNASNIARMEFLLAPLVPDTETSASDIETFLRENAYQSIKGYAVGWQADTVPGIVVPTVNTGEPVVYQRFELNMSTLPAIEGNGNGYSGTPRWLANLNPQSSTTLRKPVPTAFHLTPSYLRDSYIKRPENTDRGIPNADGVNVSAGTRVSTTGAAQKLVIREFQPDDAPLFSIAQLQHANVSSINLNPAYAIGNSLPNLYVPRDSADAWSPALAADSYVSFPNGSFNRIYDLSYLLNRALWDGYFFSTVPASLTLDEARAAAYRLPNARQRFRWNDDIPTSAEIAELKATSTAAKRLLLDGGFNINSTSVQAWRALLYSHNGVPPADSSASPPPEFKHPYSRFSAPVDGAQPNAPWLGYRILSDEQIDALATAIVAEVRSRGPFLSLADFVNRRLAADATGLKGPLQAAIDATTGSAAINTADPAMQITHYFHGDPAGETEQRTIYKGGTDTSLPGADGALPATSRAAFAPGHLTQADLLNAIGATLAARSDTFRIRAYGDVVEPADPTAPPVSRAWCEAIVQRMPDYVDDSMPAELHPDAAPASAAKTTNQTFGRRFKIVSFRWLSPNDL